MESEKGDIPASDEIAQADLEGAKELMTLQQDNKAMQLPEEINATANENETQQPTVDDINNREKPATNKVTTNQSVVVTKKPDNNDTQQQEDDKELTSSDSDSDGPKNKSDDETNDYFQEDHIFTNAQPPLVDGKHAYFQQMIKQGKGRKEPLKRHVSVSA